MKYAKVSSQGARHKVGNHWLTDYELGIDLWYTRKRLPLNSPRNMQQGFVSGAKQQDACMVASMKHAAREGRFFYLTVAWAQTLGPDSGEPLKYAREGRQAVKRARLECGLVQVAQQEGRYAKQEVSWSA
jgi:hypothetical protein